MFFFWRGHGCNLASLFSFWFFSTRSYLSHYFCRMEAKLPRTWCNPLKVTTSTGSSLCPTVLQTSFHPPSVRFTPQLLIIIIIIIIIINIINKMQVSLPTQFLHLLGRKHNGAPGCNYFGHKCAQKSVNLSLEIEVIAISRCVCLSHNT